MAKATSPIRLQEELMQSATDTAQRFHRSTAEQIEYWADIGRQTSNLIDPDTLVSLMSGLIRLKIEPIKEKTINPSDVFNALEKDRAKDQLTSNISNSVLQYQICETHAGYLEQIDNNNSPIIGQFKDGIFTPLTDTSLEC
jgi:hypothetical protein